MPHLASEAFVANAPEPEVRESIFISHATPEDNAFTLWLGNRLDAMGYDVWADIFRLKGGDNWEVILEDAIRHRAAKVLVVSNPVSVAKQGVRNEISIALKTGKGIKDDSFVIPLRTADYESSFQIVHAQRVDFVGGWAQGLRDLLETLEAAGIPRRGASARSAIWRQISLRDGRSVVETEERLVSNWLRVKSLPKEVRVYDFAGGISIGVKDRAVKDCPIPLVPQGRGFLTFASPPALHEYFGDDLPVNVIGIIDTDEFFAQGSHAYRIDANDARRHVVDMMRRVSIVGSSRRDCNRPKCPVGASCGGPTRTRSAWTRSHSLGVTDRPVVDNSSDNRKPATYSGTMESAHGRLPLPSPTFDCPATSFSPSMGDHPSVMRNECT